MRFTGDFITLPILLLVSPDARSSWLFFCKLVTYCGVVRLLLLVCIEAHVDYLEASQYVTTDVNLLVADYARDMLQRGADKNAAEHPQHIAVRASGASEASVDTRHGRALPSGPHFDFLDGILGPLHPVGSSVRHETARTASPF